MPTTHEDPPYPTANPSLVCGEHGNHNGDVVGCCHVCGLLLCEAHVYHLPKFGMFVNVLHRFGNVNYHPANPLVCGNHAPMGAIAGLPGLRVEGSNPRRWFRKQRLRARIALNPRTPRRRPPPPTSRRG